VDGFTIDPVKPPLRSPIVVLAFTGWSDTGTVTTDLADHLVATFGGTRFLQVDPEEYYVFTETRPTVSIDESGIRHLHWPENHGYAVSTGRGDHDLVVIRGAEPNLRWRTFANRLAEAIVPLRPYLVCTLVARPAATPHTRPVPVTGSSADVRLAARYGLGRSLYQGPTGILGVIHDVLRSHQLDLISLAAGVPHYLSIEGNPPATLALLRALEPVLGFPLPEGDLEEQAAAFVERVNEASRGDDQVGTYVRTLEAQYEEDDEDDEGTTTDEPRTSDLPSADDILKDVEDFLRGTGDR
jgi:hypothetical protein